MLCLGIETTAHTFGVGIVDEKANILANVKDIYKTEKGGINPSDAKKHHIDVSDEIIFKALSTTKIPIEEIDLISVSHGPGLAPCLLVGMEKAKMLAKKHKIPLVGVNHCIAHQEIGKLLCKAKNPIMLYVSGANTQVIAYEGKKYRVFGETLDQGIGNFLDSFARHIGLGFPGGPKIEQLALKGKNYIELPYSVKGMDISLAGMLTNLKHKFDSKKFSVEDLCFSMQETAFAMLVEVSERALAHCDKKELVLAGGVACNKRLVEMCNIMCNERGAKCFVPANEFLVDNGAMIAWLGILQREQAVNNPDEIDIKPYQRTDAVIVEWRK